jgi:hypothetical protein
MVNQEWPGAKEEKFQTSTSRRISVFCRMPQFTPFIRRLIYRRPFVGRPTG